MEVAVGLLVVLPVGRGVQEDLLVPVVVDNPAEGEGNLLVVAGTLHPGVEGNQPGVVGSHLVAVVMVLIRANRKNNFSSNEVSIMYLKLTYCSSLLCCYSTCTL